MGSYSSAWTRLGGSSSGICRWRRCVRQIIRWRSTRSRSAREDSPSSVRPSKRDGSDSMTVHKPKPERLGSPTEQGTAPQMAEASILDALDAPKKPEQSLRSRDDEYKERESPLQEQASK